MTIPKHFIPYVIVINALVQSASDSGINTHNIDA